ncbi:MAG: hypothetical protein QE271_00245 [Bacteriovoracaceae bacterium]|nr:hypothetical protein [Bacteriovoracaceae bacterium]
MKLNKIELPVIPSTLFWYKDFASDILELEFSLIDEGGDEDKGLLIHSPHVIICCRPILEQKLSVFNKLDFYCSHEITTKDLEQKLELFVYKHRSRKVTKEIHFFSRTQEGKEMLIMKDPNGHEWGFE